MANELQAISILVVFITVAYGVVILPVWEYLNADYKTFRKTAEVKTNQLEIIRRYLFQSFILFGFCVVPAYLIMPRAVSIISQSRLVLWNFDLMTSLFVIIDIYLWSGAIWLLYTIYKLRVRAIDLTNYIDN